MNKQNTNEDVHVQFVIFQFNPVFINPIFRRPGKCVMSLLYIRTSTFGNSQHIRSR